MILNYDLGRHDEERGIDIDKDYDYEIEVKYNDVEEYFKDNRLEPLDFVKDVEDDKFKPEIGEMNETQLLRYIYKNHLLELEKEDGFIDFLKDKYYKDMLSELKEEEKSKNIYSYLGLSKNDF